MAVDKNADDYANKRVGIFFPANNQTPADGNLTGQCVTLVKWFMAEMSSVPAPFAARGDARYVGDNLVAQGHAVEVPYDQRKRGDIVVYKYGTYGHIGVLLSGDHLFEQNANIGNVARRLIREGNDSWYVYAARIGGLGETWRPVRPNIYRLKTYVEEGATDMSKIPDADNWFWRMNKSMQMIRGRSISREEFRRNFVGVEPFRMIEVLEDDAEAERAQSAQTVGQLAVKDNWQGQIYSLQDALKKSNAALQQANTDLAAARKQLQELGDRPTKEQLDAVTAQLQAAEAKATKAAADYEKAQADIDKLRAEQAADEQRATGWLQGLAELLKRIWPGK